jgi:hypothetical protein
VLYITSMAANQDFGPFFGFTIATRTSAKLIGAAITLTSSLRTSTDVEQRAMCYTLCK